MQTTKAVVAFVTLCFLIYVFVFVDANSHSHHSHDFHQQPILTRTTPTPKNGNYQWCYNCSNRCSNVVIRIKENSESISDWERAMKFKEMAASLPRFFRGVDHLYLEDVFNLDRNSPALTFTNHKTRTFVDGDMHLYNYGTFDNSYGQVIYDMNDFDEVLIDNYFVDLYRTATSLVVHMNINKIPQKDQAEILFDFGHTYIKTVSSFVGNDDEVRSSLTVLNTDGAIWSLLDSVSSSSSRRQLLDEWTYHDADGIRRLNTDKSDLSSVEENTIKKIKQAWPQYLNSLGATHRYGKNPQARPIWIGEWTKRNTTQESFFSIKSIARRLGAGLGSLGVPRYYILCEGPSTEQDDDIILDAKYEGEPSWFKFVHEDVKWLNGFFTQQAHRVSVGMHALLSHVDTCVGFMMVGSASYIVRPRSPYKSSLIVDSLLTPIRFRSFALQLAVINAVNHARADNDYNTMFVPFSFEDELSSLVGESVPIFCSRLVDFAFMNAERIKQDYNCYLQSGLAEQAR